MGIENMAHAVSFPSRPPHEDRNLAFWMNRALEQVSALRSNPGTEIVHDLRVALRRCRSIAATLEEIDPHPEWDEMRGCARKLFRSLGDLRDTHVLTEWLNKLDFADQAAKQGIVNWFARKEKSAQEKARRRVMRFEEKQWKRLLRALNRRARIVPADGNAARCLALERLQEARELHQRAMRTENPKQWHALRNGVKRFRYTVESMLPSVHAHLGESLKRVQDVLGNIHDLDVLAEILQKICEDESDGRSDWRTWIESERGKNIHTYRQLTMGTTSVWNAWLNQFPRQAWERYATARIRATRVAMDPKLGRSQLVTRLAIRIWSQLRACGLQQVFSDKREKRVLEAAARLSGVRNASNEKSREKSAKTFLLKSSVPPHWTFAEWERAAWTVRFQRGAEPSPRHKRFSKLAAEQQAKIRLLAGILRLALAAQRCGVKSSSMLQIEVLPQGLLLHVAAVEDSPKNAARFSEAKRLLEQNLSKPILIQVQPGGADLAVNTQASEPIHVVR
jgi:CHAD domain-containing protein